jgi:hypothetical protein
MKYCVHDAEGRIVRTGHAPASALEAIQLAEGSLVMVVPDGVDCMDTTHYVDMVSETVQAMPPRPSPDHHWSYQDQAWQGSVDTARQNKICAIEAERERRIYAEVIAYDGKSIDADARGQRNITEKLNDIGRREQEGVPMPTEMLMWRDADNVDHQFADQAAYRSWLNGLAIALALRGTQAYAWSWSKKAEVAACTSVEQIAAVEV